MEPAPKYPRLGFGHLHANDFQPVGVIPQERCAGTPPAAPAEPPLGPRHLHTQDFRPTAPLTASSSLSTPTLRRPRASQPTVALLLPDKSTPLLDFLSASRAVQALAAEDPAADKVGARRLLCSDPLLLQAVTEAGPEHKAHRLRAVAVVHACLSSAWEASTVTRYESALRSTVDRMESGTGLTFLPCDNDMKFMLSCTHCQCSSVRSDK